MSRIVVKNINTVEHNIIFLASLIYSLFCWNWDQTRNLRKELEKGIAYQKSKAQLDRFKMVPYHTPENITLKRKGDISIIESSEPANTIVLRPDEGQSEEGLSGLLGPGDCSWRLGWVTEDTFHISETIHYGPVRVLIGREKIEFFGIDAHTRKQLNVVDIALGHTDDDDFDRAYGRFPMIAAT